MIELVGGNKSFKLKKSYKNNKKKINKTMKIFFYSWVIAFLAIVFFDIIWFSLTVEKFYKPNLHSIISNNFRYNIAAIFYIIYSFAISYLIIIPNIHSNSSIIHIGIAGFVMGIASYSAYNLTNQATIENWPIAITLIDTFWGGFVTSLVSAFSYYIVKYFN